MATEGNSGARNLIPPKKGEVRNPHGKPKGIEHSSTRLKRLLAVTQQLKNPITGELEGFSVIEQIDLRLIQMARNGDIKAIRELLDRLEGKALQSMDIKTQNTTEIRPMMDPAMMAEWTEFLNTRTANTTQDVIDAD